MDSDNEYEDLFSTDSSDHGTTVPDGRLSVAITMEETLDVLRMTKPLCHRHKVWVDLIKNDAVTSPITEICPDYHSCITAAVRASVLEHAIDIREVVSMALSITSLSYEHMTGKLPVAKVDCTSWIVLSSYYTMKRKVDAIKRLYRAGWKGEPIDLNPQIDMIYDATLCLFRCHNHGAVRKSILPTSLFLSVLDSIQRLWSGLAYSLALDTYGIYSISMLDRYISIVNEVTELRTKVGNSVYAILGSWHTLVTAVIIAKPNDIGCTSLLATVTDDLNEALPGFSSTRLYNLMSQPSQSLADLSILFETAGLAKAFGHPIVNVISGMSVVREHACYAKTTDLSNSEQLRVEFVRSFCHTFFRNHGRWPSLEYYPSTNPILVDAIKNNYWPRPHLYRTLPPDSFATIRLCKELDFDFHPDQFDILMDKSCAVPRSDWPGLFDRCSFQLHHGIDQPRFEPSERRVIIQFLMSDETLPRRVIQAIDDGLSPRYNDLVVLCPKEGELKEKARMFALLPYERRVFIGLTGHNLGSQILDSHSTQTMTISELKLMKTVGSLSAESRTTSSKVIILCLDFLKFNCQFRQELVMGVASEVDHLFGFKNVFQDIHPGFERSAIISNVRTRPPCPDTDGDPSPSPYCHYNQAGGQEGMAQKLWTLCAQLLILRHLSDRGLRGSLIGQGDNQVLVIRPTHTQALDLNGIALNFLQSLASFLKDNGLPLKTVESWFSDRLFQYNKESYYQGTQLHNGTKFAIKIASDSNDPLNTFDSRISTIATLAEATSRRSKSPLPSFLLYCIETITQAYDHQILGSQLEYYKVIPIWNRAIGGLPGTFLLSLVLRGHSDRLTTQLSLLQFLSTRQPQLITIIDQLSPLIFSPVHSYKLLILDPHALNLSGYIGIEPIVQKAVRSVINRITTNTAVTKFFTPEAEEKGENLIQRLVTMRPYHGRLASEIFRCSNAGVALMISGLFDSSRTLIRATQIIKGPSLMDHVRSKESEYYSEVGRRLLRPASYVLTHLLSSYECPTLMARSLRMKSWGFEVHGATSPFPGDQVRIIDFDSANDDQRNKSFLVSTSYAIQTGSAATREVIGPFPPYYGSSTAEKVYKPKLGVIHHSTQQKTTSRLLTLMSWSQRSGGPHLTKLIQELIDDKGIENPIPTSIIVGGNIHHRLSSALEKSSCLTNQLAQTASHFVFSTSLMLHYRKDDLDWTIFFQELFLYTAWRLIENCDKTPIPNMVLGYLECDECTRVVPPDPIDISVGVFEDLPPAPSAGNSPSVAPIILASIKITRLFSQLEVGSTGDMTDKHHQASVSSSTGVSIPEFRKIDPSLLCIAVALRCGPLIHWANQLKDSMQPAIVSSSFTPFADLILRSGMLDRYVAILNMHLSYSASIYPKVLGRFLFISIVNYCFKTQLPFKMIAPYYFIEERHYKQKVEDFCRTFSKALPTLVSLGSLLDDYPTGPSIECPVPTRQCAISDWDHSKHLLYASPDLTEKPAKTQKSHLPFPSYQLSRGVGCSTSAATKYIMIMSNPQFPDITPKLICACADGSGGLLGTLLHIYPSALGVFNTLIDQESMSLREPGEYLPSGLSRCNLRHRLVGYPKTILGSTNLLLDATISKLVSVVIENTSDDETVLITMDAESTIEQGWEKLLIATLTMISRIQQRTTDHNTRFVEQSQILKLMYIG